MGESIAQRLQRPQRGNGGLDRGGSLREHRGLRARNARNGGKHRTEVTEATEGEWRS